MYIGSKGLEHSYWNWALPESEHMAAIQMMMGLEHSYYNWTLPESEHMAAAPECMVDWVHMAEVVVEQFEAALEVEYMAPIVAVAAMVLAVKPIDNYMMALS